MLALLGLILGLLVGLFLNVDIPQAYSTYVGIGILACFDSIVGALAANIQKKFNIKLFLSGLIGNTVIAIALAALGDQLGIQLYLAAVFAFGNRIFINFSIIRRTWLLKTDKYNNQKHDIHADAETTTLSDDYMPNGANDEEFRPHMPEEKIGKR